MDFSENNILSRINTPADLKKLDVSDLKTLSKELRKYIVDTVSITGGHLAASLGVIELTIALHYVFDTPEDLLIWDVGHQAYGHKILTGRREEFKTNRQYKGISGFPKMSESPYDAFGVGHSSTSISAALGMAEASKLKGQKDRHHIAVIGDGSMTGGLAFEGLNNAGVSNSNLLVILNDNNIAIDKSVGALKEYLIGASASPTYNKVRNDLWTLLGKLSKFGPNAQEIASKIEHSSKTFLFKQSNLFESLKFRYFGPINGHNLVGLIKILSDLKKIQGPKILHLLTVKGKGFKPAEMNQTQFHSPGLFDSKTGRIIKSNTEGLPNKYQDVFGQTLLELARKNEKIVGITPAMPTGSSLTYMMEEIPERTYDVGIAEQHAVTFSAGMATQGFKPFCAIYSTFLQRAYDQIVHDVCLQKLPVVFCIDRAGLVGEDGATHHGSLDISFLRSIPNLVISAPINEVELRNLMFTAEQYEKGPFAIRYPKGRGVIKDWKRPMEIIEVGKGRQISNGKDIAILSIGHVGNNVIEIEKILKSKGINISHFDMRFVKPLDLEILHNVFKNFKYLITIEDGTLIGGFGSAVLEFMVENGYNIKVKRLGIPDRFIDHGCVSDLYNECGFNNIGIINAVESYLVKDKSILPIN